MRIDFARPDWTTLERQWRALEADSDGSFFQSWTWIGCRARARFSDPWLLRATRDGRVVGLALFNRAGAPLTRALGLGALHLHETGDAAEDSVFIEHNGPLLARGETGLLRPMLAAALRQGRLVLNGVGDEVLAQARALGSCHVAITRPAPFARLAGLTGEADWLRRLGASTRAHLRRSRRSHEAGGRLLVLERATDVAQGLDFLERLAALHQASWTARGRPGAFARPEFVAFHKTLVARGLPRGEVELLRLSAVERTVRPVGYLYNLGWRGRVHAYQSGLDYAAARPREAPGLTCHHLAIAAAIAARAEVYDFMAGAARYKSSLGDAELDLHWLDLARRGSLHALLHALRRSRRHQGSPTESDRASTPSEP